MSGPLDWNAKTIAEFRANQGRVGAVFEGAPLVLLLWALSAAAKAPRFALARSLMSDTDSPVC
jgi:hypothetical protein